MNTTEKLASALRELLECAKWGAVLEGADAWVDTREALAQFDSERQQAAGAGSDSERLRSIVEACRAEGFTVVTTLTGVRLMRLGKIEAQAAGAAQPLTAEPAFVPSPCVTVQFGAIQQPAPEAAKGVPSDEHLMNFLAPWCISDDPQDQRDFLAALRAALAAAQASQEPKP